MNACFKVNESSSWEPTYLPILEEIVWLYYSNGRVMAAISRDIESVIACKWLLHEFLCLWWRIVVEGITYTAIRS